MKGLQLYSSSRLTASPVAVLLHHHRVISGKTQRCRNLKLHSAKSSGFSLNSSTNRCQKCKGQGAIECPGCKGSGKNKKNGNIFERWKCFECQGFGLKSCPVCGKGGLTPEQRGER